MRTSRTWCSRLSLKSARIVDLNRKLAGLAGCIAPLVSLESKMGTLPGCGGCFDLLVDLSLQLVEAHLWMIAGPVLGLPVTRSPKAGEALQSGSCRKPGCTDPKAASDEELSCHEQAPDCSIAAKRGFGILCMHHLPRDHFELRNVSRTGGVHRFCRQKYRYGQRHSAQRLQ